jgi:hypothetical protein
MHEEETRRAAAIKAGKRAYHAAYQALRREGRSRDAARRVAGRIGRAAHAAALEATEHPCPFSRVVGDATSPTVRG